MRASIPRFLLTTAGDEGGARELFGTRLADGQTALFAFSTRQSAEAFLNTARLEGAWVVTYVGYDELRGWLEQAREAGFQLLIRDVEGPAEMLVDAAEVATLIDVLTSRPDTGDEIEAEFRTYSGSRLA